MSFDVVSHTLAAAVANGGSFTVAYPAGRDSGDYQGGYDHVLIAVNALFKATAGEIAVSFDASNVAVTYNGATTLPAGTVCRLQFDRSGADSDDDALADPGKMARSQVVEINLGAPDAAVANGVCASQAGTQDTAMTLDGGLVAGGVAVFDVPRNVVGAWTNSAKLTITGTDADGNTVVEETAAAGTSHTGKKAFKTVTSVVPSANITGATVGTGDVFGLPVFLPQKGNVLKELQDGAAPTAGTLVAGDSTKATATTGDVRGTYDPNAAADGAKAFQLIAALGDPSYKGVSQYGG